MNAKTDDRKITSAELGTLGIIRDAARSARARIQDSRAREAIAIFEHELSVRLETMTKLHAAQAASAPPPGPPLPPPPRPSVPPPPRPRPAFTSTPPRKPGP
jgi:hypothetical protein